MLETVEYKFKIDVFTPESIPMDRLAEYMSDLADLMGESADVHFGGLESGSMAIVSKIKREAYPKVRERVYLARRDEGDRKARTAVRALNDKLTKDNGSAVLLDESEGAEILQFPGRKQRREIIGPVSQRGSLDGVVIVIGGESDPVPIHLQSGEQVYNCKARRPIAKKLAPFLFDREIRIFGIGRWYRDDAKWRLDTFTIADFEPLDAAPLSVVIAKLHSIQGNEWGNFDDSWAELDAIRNGDR